MRMRMRIIGKINYHAIEFVFILDFQCIRMDLQRSSLVHRNIMQLFYLAYFPKFNLRKWYWRYLRKNGVNFEAKIHIDLFFRKKHVEVWGNKNNNFKNNSFYALQKSRMIISRFQGCNIETITSTLHRKFCVAQSKIQTFRKNIGKSSWRASQNISRAPKAEKQSMATHLCRSAITTVSINCSNDASALDQVQSTITIEPRCATRSAHHRKAMKLVTLALR